MTDSPSVVLKTDSNLADEPNAKKRRRSKACLECRALKIACIPASPNSDICQRCSRFGFGCVFTPNKRGRKPKSKLGQLNRSAESALATLAAEAEAHPRLSSHGLDTSQSRLSLSPGDDGEDVEGGHMFDSGLDTRSESDNGEIDEAAETRRGQTWTFLNQPDTNKSAPQDTTETDGARTVEHVSQPGDTPTEARKRRKGTFSMRDMLQPVGPVATDFLPEPEMTMDMAKRELTSDDDPVSLGYISERIARLLVDFYFTHMNSWFGVLDTRYDNHDTIRARSPFLYTAVLGVASLLNQQQIHLPITQELSTSTDRVFLQPFAHQQISLLAVNHATAAFIDGHSSLGVVQAFFLLSTWKSPDDSISYLRTGYAAKLSMDLELSRKQTTDPEMETDDTAHWWRSRQRMWLNLFVQDRVQGCQYFNSYMLPLRDPLIEDCSTWHRHPQALLSDVVLVASVQSRRIQSNFRDQISLILSSTSCDSGDKGKGGQRSSRYVMLQLLIESLQSALTDWYGRWKDELIRVYDAPQHPERKTELDERLRVMRIWKYAIQVHLCSFALSDSLEDKGEGDALGGPQKALLGLAAFRPVLEGTRGILQEFASLSPVRLRSAPDTMSILPDLAAVCLWKLAQIRGNHMSSTLDYSAITLPLISEVVKVYRAAIIDRTDGVLLHARFLSSVGGRIRRLSHSKRKHSRRPRATDPAQSGLAGSGIKHDGKPSLSSPSNPSATPFKLDQLLGITPSTTIAMGQGDSADPMQQTMPMYPEFDDIFEGINLDSAIPGVPDTTMPDFDLAFNCDHMGNGLFGSGNGVDPLSSMQGHPLGAFSFDMDLMSLLSGSMGQTQPPTTSAPTSTPASAATNGLNGQHLVNGGITTNGNLNGLNSQQQGSGGFGNGPTPVGNGGDLNWPFNNI